MPTYVTRIVVTQTDEPPGPEEFAAPSGYTRWVMEWTKTTNGKESHFKHAHYAIESARKMTMNLLQQIPPGMTRGDVLTLIGLEG